jgi:hypothetical protein
VCVSHDRRIVELDERVECLLHQALRLQARNIDAEFRRENL